MKFGSCKQALINVLFPENNACHLCGRFTETPGILCSVCQHELLHLQYKKLRIASDEPHAPLAVCLAAWPHKNEARELVHLLKYQSDCIVSKILGEGMAAALALSPARPSQIDAIVPVPLHSTRLEQRGFNQALLLAQAVCNHTQLPLLDNTLVRLHATDTQLHRDRVQRLQAMRHAFAVPDAALISGKHLLLMDDVLTTGATAMACAHALLGAGAASVSLLTACRA